MSEEIKWAVLGTGVIANEMAAGLQKMGKSLYAVGNRTYDKAVAFAEKYGIEKVYPSIDEMFATVSSCCGVFKLTELNSKCFHLICHGLCHTSSAEPESPNLHP